MLRATAAKLSAKPAAKEKKEYDETSATKYRGDRGRCPRGWRYNKKTETCQVRRPKASVPDKAPVIEGVGADTNKLLSDLHEKSKPLTAVPKPLEGTALTEFQDRSNIEAEKWFSGLPAEEQGSLSDYTMDGYTSVNQYLRGRKSAEAMRKKFPEHAIPDDKRLVDMSRNVKKALSRASLPEAVTVQRGTFNPDLVAKFKSGSLTGQSVKTDQFYSTTADPKIAQQFLDLTKKELDDEETPIMWNIAMPKGAKAMALGKTSQYPEESEVLLDEGSELEVLGAEIINGVLHLSAAYRGP